MPTLTEKRCSRCKNIKPTSEFYFHKVTRDKRKTWNSRCKRCDRDYQREWEATPQRQRARETARLKRKYGISVDEYDAMLAAQVGGCAICGEVPTYRLHVDHCHSTGSVRGLLCNGCNAALGKFCDDPEMLRHAALYLDHHNPPES